MRLDRNLVDLLNRIRRGRSSGPDAALRAPRWPGRNDPCRSRCGRPGGRRPTRGTSSALGKTSGASGPGSRTPKPPLISAIARAARGASSGGDGGSARARHPARARVSASMSGPDVDLAADRPIAADGRECRAGRGGRGPARRSARRPRRGSRRRAHRGARALRCAGGPFEMRREVGERVS